MQDFRNVEAWAKAHALVLRTYQETNSFPQDEVFGLKLQLRRGATGIAAKIAEGCGKERDADFAIDLRKATASCYELEYLILLACDLDFLPAEVGGSLSDELIRVRKMILGLVRKL